MDDRLWPCPLAVPAPRPEHVDACLVLRPRYQIESERAIVGDEALRDQANPGRSIDLKLRHLARALVPSGQQEAWIVADVIVMMVAEEHVGDLRRADAELEEPMMRPESVIESDELAADLDQIAGAHAAQRRRRGSRSQKPESHPVGASRSDCPRSGIIYIDA